jgi:OmpA-OmpF porin, OOP family
MKKSLLLTSLIFVLVSCSNFGQSTKYDWLHQSSWVTGFGFSYPRYISTSLRGGDFGSYGVFASIQRNFSEHVAFRLEGNYLHLADRQRVFLGNQDSDNSLPKIENDILLANFQLMYYLVPCEPVSPYFGLGVAGVSYKLKNSPIVVTQTSSESRPLDVRQTDYELNAFIGAEWRVAENWKLKSEFTYHSAASSKFDGIYGTETGGILGAVGDTYLTLDLGVLYYFGYGAKSNICQIYDGINTNIDYDKIEEIVKRYQVQPSEVDYNRIEDIVKRYRTVPNTVIPENWVLIGINFDFNKATIKPESVPILYNAAEILLKNPQIKVEIQGHTDYIGSDKYNQSLSLQRAETVKNYFVAFGVSSKRLTTVGYGKSRPIMDNSTEQGRALNRRIELKVIK